MPLQATSGAASYDAFGGGVPVVVNYIEDVFSTYLYTGNGATYDTIINGVDLSGKGGLVWTKGRSAVVDHYLEDTVRGAGNAIRSNLTAAQNAGGVVGQFNNNGFTVFGAASTTYASWTFRKQPKFFDVVTYTGTGSNTTIAHSLGSVPGCIMVKRTNTTADWAVYHRSLANTQYLVLNSTAAVATGATWWNSTTPTSAVFSVGTDASVNASGGTYVAYIFAHDAGGFGLTGTDNVISCGSFTYDSTNGNSINLGYEAQWVLLKRATGGTGNWIIQDVMRGMPDGPNSGARLNANSSGAEDTSATIGITSTGFNVIPSFYANGNNIIYIAIRRGPMKIPTDATKVFSPINQLGLGTVTTNFPVDLTISTIKNQAQDRWVIDRLRGASGTASAYMYTNTTDVEATTSGYGLAFDNNVGYKDTGVWNATKSIIYWNWRRAPSVFDIVCYTGTGSATTFTHNLVVAPELIIIKSRTAIGSDWPVYATAVGATKVAYLDGTGAFNTSSTSWNNTATTSSVFTVGTSGQVNSSGDTYVAYLFATCAGVSKVGSYTGNGTTQTINCGFGAGGARFVLIKRTDSTGDWHTYDTARGMTVLTDPYLLLNTTAAESATLGSVTTVSTGFALDSTILAAINISAASYIFLAIA